MQMPTLPLEYAIARDLMAADRECSGLPPSMCIKFTRSGHFESGFLFEGDCFSTSENVVLTLGKIESRGEKVSRVKLEELPEYHPTSG
ncbi:hypothetical protein TNIN_490601 [Trichonephila inaurata madagascariensis]|uniref:Uncharacterized protein n=1 Tax=Trichonephila inaurata madagascariensis TaxID=2747483 RepID=A0A8X6WZU7_9ARAC|nr:hypothetical protein TNIN_490601 [Trichonephila inaurata madagascariensis]